MLQEGAIPTPRSEDEVRFPWSMARQGSQVDDGRSSFYSVGSRKASGSFANNLGLLSRREDRPGPGKLRIHPYMALLTRLDSYGSLY